MPEGIDTKIARADLSKIGDGGLYDDPPDDDTVSDDDFASGDGYIRECIEIQGMLDKYMITAKKRLCTTVKVYNCKEYSQEFLQSLIKK